MSQQQIDPAILAMMANAEANAEEVIQSENTLGQRLPADVQGACTLTNLSFEILDEKGKPGEKGYAPKAPIVKLNFVVDTPEKYSGFKNNVGTPLRASAKRTVDQAYKAALDTIELAGYPRERRTKFTSYQEIFDDISKWLDEEDRVTGFRTYQNGDYVNVQFTPVPEQPTDTASQVEETMYLGNKVKVLSESGEQVVIEFLEGSKQGETKEIHRSELG